MSKLIFILAAIFTAQPSWGSFTENSKRYLAPKDFFTLLAQKFPVTTAMHANASLSRDLDPRCVFLGLGNTNQVALSLPSVGSPASANPTSGLIRWWGSCLDGITSKQNEMLRSMGARDEKLWSKFWAPELIEKLRDKNDKNRPFHKFDDLEWKDLTARQRDTQVRFLIEELIGPNSVIEDLKFAKGIGDLSQTISAVVPDASTLKLNEANKQLLIAIGLREEFLTY